MTIFLHMCLTGKNWMLHTLTPMIPGEIPRKCPEKIDCGNPWDEIDPLAEGEAHNIFDLLTTKSGEEGE